LKESIFFIFENRAMHTRR